MKPVLYLLLGIGYFLMLSCDNPPEKPPKTDYEIKEEKKKVTDSLNEVVVGNFSKKYNSVSLFDTSLSYTYEYQSVFKKQPLNFVGTIIDIIKVDGGYLIKLKSASKEVFAGDDLLKQMFLASIFIADSVFPHFQKLLSINQNKGAFICNISSVNTINENIVSSMNDENGKDEEYAYVHSEYVRLVYHLKGTLIDCFLYEHNEFEDNN